MRIGLLFLAIILLSFSPKIILATPPSISNAPATTNTDSPFLITGSMTGLSANSIYRLRIALAPLGTSNYFGSTFNGNFWYNGVPSPINYSNFLSVTTDSSGAWSGSIQGKIESSDPGFSGAAGTYDLKVGRYTENGSSATWSNILQIGIIVTAPSPSPATTPISSPSPSSDPSQTISFTINDIPSQINSDQSFSIGLNLSMPNNPNTDYYLKGAFKKSDGTRYMGLTKKDSTWIEYGDDYSDQYKITTNSSGIWTGNMEFKPDIYDNDYKGSGAYLFKVGRYTLGGSGPTWSNEATINIISSETVPIANPSPSIKPSLYPLVVSKTKNATLSPDKLVYRIASVAGTTASASVPAKPSTGISLKSERQTNPLIWTGIIFIIAGGGTIGYIYLNKNAKVPFKF